MSNGGNRGELLQTIRKADRGASGPAITAMNSHVTIGAGSTARSATVWLVRYESRTLDVPICAGENDGKTLVHRDVVRSIDAVGSWTGARVTIAIPASTNPADRTAVIIQQDKGEPVIAAAKLQKCPLIQWWLFKGRCPLPGTARSFRFPL